MGTWADLANLNGAPQSIYEVSNKTEFSIFNGGDEVIDPCQQSLLIEVVGPSDQLTIENVTTGDKFEYYGTTNPGDTLQLDDVQALKNGVNILSNTNMEVVTIAPGWNEFKITGTTGLFSIKFNFRFYYV